MIRKRRSPIRRSERRSENDALIQRSDVLLSRLMNKRTKEWVPKRPFLQLCPKWRLCQQLMAVQKMGVSNNAPAWAFGKACCATVPSMSHRHQVLAVAPLVVALELLQSLTCSAADNVPRQSLHHINSQNVLHDTDVLSPTRREIAWYNECTTNFAQVSSSIGGPDCGARPSYERSEDWLCM